MVHTGEARTPQRQWTLPFPRAGFTLKHRATGLRWHDHMSHVTRRVSGLPVGYRRRHKKTSHQDRIYSKSKRVLVPPSGCRWKDLPRQLSKKSDVWDWNHASVRESSRALKIGPGGVLYCVSPTASMYVHRQQDTAPKNRPHEATESCRGTGPPGARQRISRRMFSVGGVTWGVVLPSPEPKPMYMFTSAWTRSRAVGSEALRQSAIRCEGVMRGRGKTRRSCFQREKNEVRWEARRRYPCCCGCWNRRCVLTRLPFSRNGFLLGKNKTASGVS